MIIKQIVLKIFITALPIACKSSLLKQNLATPRKQSWSRLIQCKRICNDSCQVATGMLRNEHRSWLGKQQATPLLYTIHGFLQKPINMECQTRIQEYSIIMFLQCKDMTSNLLLQWLQLYKSNPKIGRQNMVKIAVNLTNQPVRQTLTDRESIILIARLIEPYISPNCSLPKTRSTVTIMMRATKNLLISILQRRVTYACQPRNAYCSFTTYSMGKLYGSTMPILQEEHVSLLNHSRWWKTIQICLQTAASEGGTIKTFIQRFPCNGRKWQEERVQGAQESHW